MDEHWEKFTDAVLSERTKIKKLRTKNVNRSTDRDRIKELCRGYLREARPKLLQLDLDQERIESLDADVLELLRLAEGQNAKSSYEKLFDALRSTVQTIGAERELKLGVMRSDGGPRRSILEESILRTLNEMIPSAAMSYEQCLRDLQHAEDRVSFRGTANELRECLREVLNHLAPEKDVMAAEGFKLEKNRNKPTMKQQVAYILSARGTGKTKRKAPELAARTVEELVSALARAVYDRASVSAHIAGTRQEVSNAKNYLDSVLADLLQLG